MSLRLQCYADEIFYLTDLDWRANRLFLPERPKIPETLSPALESVGIGDGGRSWSGSTQDLAVNFNEACTGDATGWSATVNGVSKTLTYISGSGTQSWVFRVGALVHDGDVIRLTYDTATGTTKSSSGSVQITGVNNVPFADQLSKRIRFILCDKNDAVVASEAVKAALFDYDSNIVINDKWMLKTDKGTVTTDGSGQFDMQYTGTAAVGSQVYVAVIRASENMIVADTVV